MRRVILRCKVSGRIPVSTWRELMGEVGNAPVVSRSALFWMVSRVERRVLVAEEYAGRL